MPLAHLQGLHEPPLFRRRTGWKVKVVGWSTVAGVIGLLGIRFALVGRRVLAGRSIEKFWVWGWIGGRGGHGVTVG